MLLFKFTEVRTVRQAMKAFNRITQSGADRERNKGRRFARPQTPEKAFAPLIKEGVVKVIRRRGKPPLIRMIEE